jgi:drug/metabolite transporter (DMT)-like permease
MNFQFSKNPQTFKAFLYVLLCVFCWAPAPIVSTLGQRGLDNHQFLFWSSAVSCLVLLLITLVTKRGKFFFAYSKKDWVHMFFLGFLGTYLMYIFLYFGYAHARGLEILALQYTWPIFIVILSIFILKEKLTALRAVSISLGFLGVLFVITKGDFSQIHLDNLSVDLFVLAGTLAFALFSVLGKKVRFEPYTMNTIFFLSATVISFLSMLWFSTFALPTYTTWIPILINGIFVNGISYILWIQALRNADASFIAPFVFLTPILASLYLILFFDEPLLPAYGIGLILILLGGILNKGKSTQSLKN